MFEWRIDDIVPPASVPGRYSGIGDRRYKAGYYVEGPNNNPNDGEQCQ